MLKSQTKKYRISKFLTQETGKNLANETQSRKNEGNDKRANTSEFENR